MIKAMKILATGKGNSMEVSFKYVLHLSLGSADFQLVACFERVKNKTILQRCM